MNQVLLPIWGNPKDCKAAIRAILSAGMSSVALRNASESKVRDAVAGAITPYKQHDGSYTLRNRFLCLTSRA